MRHLLSFQIVMQPFVIGDRVVLSRHGLFISTVTLQHPQVGSLCIYEKSTRDTLIARVRQTLAPTVPTMQRV